MCVEDLVDRLTGGQLLENELDRDTRPGDHGLPHLAVTGIQETDDGLIWLATFGGGLAAYDGSSFRVYTTDDGLPSDELLGLRRAGDGGLLVPTRNGVASLSQGHDMTAITEAGGEAIGMTYDVLTDASGTTWLATLDRGVISTDGRHIAAPTADGDEEAYWAWSLATDASDCVWVAPKYTGGDAHVYRYDPRDQRVECVSLDVEESARPVRHGARHVRCDRQGWMWVAHRGVTAHDGDSWRHLDIPLHGSTLTDTRLTYEDREGNIWVGFWGGGLAFCDPESVIRYAEEDGLPDLEVTQLAEDGTGRLWIGTMSGLARIDQEGQPPKAFGFPSEGMVMSLAAGSGGRMWVGTDLGAIHCWDGDESRSLSVASAEGEVKALHEGPGGRLWVGLYTGELGWIDDRHFVPVPNELRWIQVLLEDGEGRLWIGRLGAEHGVYWYRDGEFHQVVWEGQQPIYVHALCQTADGTVWIGTGSGLFAYRDGEVEHFTVEDGLSENVVLSLAPGADGVLWLGTSGGGAVRYDGASFQVVRLGSSAAENIVEAILVDRLGRLWCGTRAGLVLYRPGRCAPTVIIRWVSAGETQREPQVVTVLDSVPTILIAFRGIGFRSGARQMRYSHRTNGPEGAGQWTPFTAVTEASITGLAPGDHSFEVRAMDRDGLVSEPAQVTLVVEPDPQRSRLAALEQMLREPPGWHSFVGRSEALQKCLEQIAIVAETDVAVLVLGETGTGKGLAAHSLHEMSRRKERPFIQVNCGALPDGIIESELFGYEKGAFTGAYTRKLGRFELADGGTLFLDEIGDLSLESQRVLLHVLEEKSVERLGGETTVPVDVRVVAATNRDLRRAVREELFREDLFYRLSEFVVELPPLRQRQEDIPLLVQYFLERSARHLNRGVPDLDAGVMAALQGYRWPGNIRELEHLIQRALLVCSDGRIRLADLAELGGTTRGEREGEGTPPGGSPTLGLDEAERQHIVRALEATNWTIYGEQGAARLLDVHPEKLRSRMRKHGIARPGRH